MLRLAGAVEWGLRPRVQPAPCRAAAVCGGRGHGRHGGAGSRAVKLSMVLLLLLSCCKERGGGWPGKPASAIGRRSQPRAASSKWTLLIPSSVTARWARKVWWFTCRLRPRLAGLAQRLSVVIDSTASPKRTQKRTCANAAGARIRSGALRRAVTSVARALAGRPRAEQCCRTLPAAGVCCRSIARVPRAGWPRARAAVLAAHGLMKPGPRVTGGR